MLARSRNTQAAPEVPLNAGAYPCGLTRGGLLSLHLRLARRGHALIIGDALLGRLRV